MERNEGIALYRKQPFDLVILNIMIPGKDGLDVIKEFRSDYPDIRIVTISGADSIGLINLLPLSEKLGALRAIPKPIDQKDLLSVIQYIDRRYGLRQNGGADGTYPCNR